MPKIIVMQCLYFKIMTEKLLSGLRAATIFLNDISKKPIIGLLGFLTCMHDMHKYMEMLISGAPDVTLCQVIFAGSNS